MFSLSALLVAASILIEAECFDRLGGWSVDTQHLETMGSAYLLAHGLGVPVADATTEFTLDEAGDYSLWVRTRNWSAPWSSAAAGRFQVAVDGEVLPTEFGVGGGEWNWVRSAKPLKLKSGAHRLALKDLTGFDGRVDAVALTLGTDPAALRTEPAISQSVQCDLVVCGGGMAGVCAAIAAARQGLKVALLQDRPVLGGNNSSEVRVWLGGHIHVGKYPRLGDVVEEIAPAGGGNARSAGFFEDERKLKAVRDEKNIALHLGTKAMAVEMDGDRIAAVVGWRVRTGERLRFTAPLFVDATGDGALGALAGADFRVGRESRSETGERLAPATGDRLTMGASCQWRAVETGEAQEFRREPWMVELSDQTATAALRGDWDWETGLDRDQVREAERIRDYGLLMAYSNWAFVKNRSRVRDQFATKRLDWVAYVAGKRESRRLLGELVLTSEDLLKAKVYPDGTCSTSWSIDLHYPKTEAETGFKGESFRSKCHQDKIVIYPIPYRCFYSRNVANLFMAGRNISVTHAALGSVRVMRTTGMMGEVVGLAAAVCQTCRCLPRQVYAEHFAALEAKLAVGAGRGVAGSPQTYNLHPTLGQNAQMAELRELHGMLTWAQTRQYWDRRIYGKDRDARWDYTPGFSSGAFSAGEVTVGTIHCLASAKPELYVGETRAELESRIRAHETVELRRGTRPDEWRTPSEQTFYFYSLRGNIKDTWYCCQY